MNLHANIQRTAPAMETTTDVPTEAAAIAEAKDYDFPPGSEATIALADSPEVHMTSKVHISSKNLRIKIMRKDQEALADRFTGKYVRVEESYDH